MPFNGSGNFTRLYRWQDDRDNGIKILASKMDGEFDNFAAGMNSVFFRNGLVPMSGNLNVGQNYIIGLGAGTPGSPSIRWADDVSSGVFLNGVGKPSLVAGGTTRLEANSTGVLVTGTLNASGAVSSGGSGLGTTALNNGGSGFTGSVDFLNAAGVRQGYIGLAAPSGRINLQNENGCLGYQFAATPRVGSNDMYHAGNLTGPIIAAQIGYTPANRAGDTFTGTVIAPSIIASFPGNGTASLVSAASIYTGYVSFTSAAGSRQGYIGFGSPGARIPIISDTGAGYQFDVAPYVGTNVIYHAGNLSTASFMLRANNLSDVASVPSARTSLGVTATGNDTTYGYRANNLNDVASVVSARSNLGVTATGADTTYNYRASNLSDVANAATARSNLGIGSNATRAFTASNAAPSGGADGDVWYKY